MLCLATSLVLYYSFSICAVSNYTGPNFRPKFDANAHYTCRMSHVPRAPVMLRELHQAIEPQALLHRALHADSIHSQSIPRRGDHPCTSSRKLFQIFDKND